MTSVDHVLFPGRHHLVTRFQVEYLHALSRGEITDTGGQVVALDPAAVVVWGVTSATHTGTRRNPLPAHRREAMIERVSVSEHLPSLVAPIPDVPMSARFAVTVLGNVEMTTGRSLTPQNTVVACSTPAVAAMYAELGFRIVTVEAGVDPTPARPWDVLELMVAGDPTWRDLAHDQSVTFYDQYRLDDAVRLIHTDPTVGSEGDLTETRDYRTYTAAFDDASDRKWEQVAPFVVPGRVVDLGCAAGGLLERAARDPRLAESDLYGVDVSRHLVAEAEHRKAQGVFANPSVYFAQRNLLRSSVFPSSSVNTTITVALTHEISSYGDGRADLERLATRIFEHTAPGGVWINSDVLGPDDGDTRVHLRFEPPPEPVADAVDLTGWDRQRVHDRIVALTPAGRLAQFARDFPKLAGAQLPVDWDRGPDGEVRGAWLSRRDAMEFLYTRDYTDNWLSECHERFCDLTWSDWVDLVTSVGFEVAPGSGPWRNDWLVENRLSHGVAVTVAGGADAVWPSTHLLLVARKPVG
ncbi:methyltransferase domain-containing protein [Cellulomonas sp. Leaf334]|uniref:methyltransferase domain-containing protein n=1 Tax=Cellulomonas sp. Leaf334 TaxID=1736339 RepID=UPI0006F72FB7|nr:methyltransferase domain-containing protein [Cellulomonas sp. Leaf334]KQR16649.1 methyltransferase [Cellulomonas sp. Leaf334]